MYKKLVMEFFLGIITKTKGENTAIRNKHSNGALQPVVGCSNLLRKKLFFRACKSFLQQSKSMQSCKKLQELITFFLISIKILIISHF